MFWLAPLSLSDILLGAVVFGAIYLIVRSRKKAKAEEIEAKEQAAIESKTTTKHLVMQDIIAQHSDCTAEVVNVFVSGEENARVSNSVGVGDRVALSIDEDDFVCLKIGGHNVAEILALPESSQIPALIKGGSNMVVFVGGRNVGMVSDTTDCLSLIVFYHLPGVPPTKVSLE